MYVEYIITSHFLKYFFPTNSSIFKPKLMATFHAEGKPDLTMLVGDEEFV
jgi:hypothetical protein